MFFKTFDEQNLYYELAGNLQSECSILFLNGISQSTVAWQSLLPAFSRKYRIVLCDLIFQGKSDKSANARDFDQHAADVYELLNSLKIGKVNLVGISYGSLVAQHIALNYPEKIDKLVLLSTFAHKTAYYEAIELAWRHTLDVGGFGLMLDVMLPMIFGENYFEQPLIPMDTLKSMRQITNSDPEALKKLMKATQMRGDYRQKLKALNCPTLIIHGEQDTLLLLHMGKEVSDSISGSTFKIIEGAGHTLNIEAVPQLVKLISEFI
jgi:3-oxoadipate enol-lactonase